MLVNPDIKQWFDALQGRPLGAGGAAPRGEALPNYGSSVLGGIVRPGSGMFGFNAPSIQGSYHPVQPLPNPGMRGMMGTPPVAPTSAGLAPGMNLGGGAIAAGLGKLGQGVETAVGGIAAKQKARQADLDAAAGRNGPSPYGTPPAPPARPGEPTPPARPAGLGSSPAETFPPVGAASTLPLQAQIGAGVGETGTAIGPGGSLPTFAQRAPGASPAPSGGIAAFRYNNPGNISLPMSGWNGGGEIVGIKNQPGYASFPDMQTGMGAFQHRVSDYIDAKGLNTIAALNSRYATDPNWTHGVAQASGLDPHAQLDTSNKEQMSALQKGILTQEMGATNANKVLSAAAPQTGAAAYAAKTPSAQEPATALAGQVPAPDTSSQPQLGPVQHGDYNGQDYIYQVPAGGSTPAVPVPTPQYVPGQQGMNDQMNPLAAALAQGGNQPPPIDPTFLALALSQGSSPDFGGGGGFGGFGGGFGGLFG